MTITATKWFLYKLVFGKASYDSECWVLKNIRKKTIGTCGLGCNRRLLHISYGTIVVFCVSICKMVAMLLLSETF